MTSFSCRSALLLVFLVFGACDCGDPVLQECANNSECPDGQMCVSNVCVDPAADAGDAGDTGGDAAMCEAPTRPCADDCCEAGESCDGTECCPTEDLCGGSCCAGDCLAGECVVSCEEGEVLCGSGADATCCDAASVCYSGACIVPGDECEFNRECPEGEYCDQGVGRCLPLSEGSDCTYTPEVAEEFENVTEWSWTGDDTMTAHIQVMHAPVVANLNDDNGDGVVDEHDIPDVVFSTFAGGAYNSNGVIRAVSGDSGVAHWPTGGVDPGYRVRPSSELAIAELDSTSFGPEIVACSDASTGLLIAADGTVIRALPFACAGAPAIADMDGDGVPEIALNSEIVHADGTLVISIPGGLGYAATFANFDDDEDLEVLGRGGVYEMDGSAIWTHSPGFTYTAVADLDLDGDPEVVGVASSSHTVYVLDGRTGAAIWSENVNLDLATPRGPSGGGPPTIANFDADPEPEIALAAGYAYVIFDPDGSVLWTDESTNDTSSRSTGSSVFDFEGDGVAEVLYNDEQRFRVYRGPDGSEYFSRCNTSGTLQEYPLVVDVDNDGQAEIVLMENSYAFRCDPITQGIHVFGHPDNQWVSTRRIWNQHSYHVTNINEDGTVPRREETNWTVPGLNNFRQNVQPDGALNAPDLVAEDLTPIYSMCPTNIGLRLRVVNDGAASAPAGIPVAFYEVTADPAEFLGVVNTTRRLLPGESEVIELSPGFTVPDPDRREPYRFEAVINDPDHEPLGGVNECRPDNNRGGPVAGLCGVLG